MRENQSSYIESSQEGRNRHHEPQTACVLRRVYLSNPHSVLKSETNVLNLEGERRKEERPWTETRKLPTLTGFETEDQEIESSNHPKDSVKICGMVRVRHFQGVTSSGDFPFIQGTTREKGS